MKGLLLAIAIFSIASFMVYYFIIIPVMIKFYHAMEAML